MNKYCLAFLLALVVVLASVTLRKSFAAVGDSKTSWASTSIGGSPMPPIPNATSIGGSPMPPIPNATGIGGSPMPPIPNATSIGGSPMPPIPNATGNGRAS